MSPWQRKRLVQSRLRSLLWREWTRPLERWSPGDVFDADGACWPFSRRDRETQTGGADRLQHAAPARGA